MRHWRNEEELEEVRRSKKEPGRATESQKEPGRARTSQKQAQASPAGGGLSGSTKPLHREIRWTAIGSRERPE